MKRYLYTVFTAVNSNTPNGIGEYYSLFDSSTLEDVMGTLKYYPDSWIVACTPAGRDTNIGIRCSAVLVVQGPLREIDV